MVPWRGKGRSGTGVLAWCLSSGGWACVRGGCGHASAIAIAHMRTHRARENSTTVASLLTGMPVFKHPGIIIRVYGFKIFVLKNGTARCSFS